MKVFLYLLISTCGFISFISSATDEIKNNKSFVISHVAHPKIGSINRIIEQVYTSLGFKVEFIPAPITRGLSLLNDGTVDADSIRIIDNVKNYKNILLIEPAILNLSVVIICKRGLPCSKEVLKDENASILLDRGNIQLIDRNNIDANIILNEKSDITVKLLKAGRYDYAVYTVDRDYRVLLEQNFNLADLATPKFHHIINKKYRALIPQIERKLREALMKTEYGNIIPSNTSAINKKP